MFQLNTVGFQPAGPFQQVIFSSRITSVPWYQCDFWLILMIVMDTLYHVTTSSRNNIHFVVVYKIAKIFEFYWQYWAQCLKQNSFGYWIISVGKLGYVVSFACFQPSSSLKLFFCRNSNPQPLPCFFKESEKLWWGCCTSYHVLKFRKDS